MISLERVVTFLVTPTDIEQKAKDIIKSWFIFTFCAILVINLPYELLWMGDVKQGIVRLITNVPTGNN